MWTTLGNQPAVPTVGVLENRNIVVLRAVPINAPMRIVCDQLQQQAQRFDRSDSRDDSKVEVISHGPMNVEVRKFADSGDASLTFFIQPVDRDRSVIRGALSSYQEPAEPMSLLRFFSTTLNEIRDHIESNQVPASRDPQKPPDVSSLSPELFHRGAGDERSAGQSLTVRVSEKRLEADGIVALELTSEKFLLLLVV